MKSKGLYKGRFKIFQKFFRLKKNPYNAYLRSLWVKILGIQSL